MNMPTTRTLLRLLPALVILAVVAVGTMGAGAVSPDTVAQTESPGTADASSPNAYDYVDDETGVVTTNGLIDAIEDFRRGPPNDISTETLLDVLESFRSGTPLAGFEFTDQPVTQTNGTITVTDLEAPGGEGLTTDHLVVFNGATTDADAIVGSVQLESLEGVTPNQSVEIDRVDIPIDNRSMDESGNYTVALHASTDGDPNPAVVRPGTVQTASVTVTVDGTVLEFREVNGEVTDDPVTEGEELTAYAAIENTGDNSTTETAKFRVDGEVFEQRERTLDPGEREKLLFTYNTGSGDSPSVDASLALGETETATTTAEVRRSSEFIVNIGAVTDPVLATGNITRDLTAEVRVENLGGGTGTLSENITLSVNGTDTDSQNVTLQDGETTRIDLSGNGSKVTESETSVTAAVDTPGGDSSDRIVTLRGPVKNIDTGETFERLQPAVDGSGEADTIRIDDNLTEPGEQGGETSPDSTLNPTVDIDTDGLTVTTDDAERSINASLRDTEVLNVTGDNVTIDGIDKNLTTTRGNVIITGDNNTIRNVTIVGNLILNGSDTTTSNVDVTGERVGNVQATAQTPSNGNIIINGANSAVDGVSTEGDIVIDASDVAVTDSSATNVTVTSNGDDANVNNVDASEFDVDPGADNTETGGSAITAAPGDDLDAKVTNAGDSGVPTVRLQAGTYEQSVTVDVEGLTLEPAAGASPTIVGDGVTGGSQPHAAIHVDDGSGPVRNVTIKGFTVENPNGKFGIFAGTGTTNSKDDGISGLVIRDNVVQNISTTSSGSALTGGPAGIGIRADYGTSGNPGIEISNNKIDNVENLQGGPEPVGITLKSFTGDAGFGFDSNGNAVTDTASPPATDTDILNNEISNISSNGGFATKGISVSGEFKDVDVINNTLSDIESPGGDARAITFSENGGSYSGNKYDIDADGSGERIGPQDFNISGNTISSVNSADDRSVNFGGYEQFGSHNVSQNTINDGAVTRFAGSQPGFQPGDGDAVNLVANTFTSQTSQLYVSDGSQSADLTTVLNDNTFNAAVEVVGAQIRAEGTAPADAVVNLDTGDTFTGTTAIQDAVDNANSDNTLRVGSGTFDESVTINIEGLTLEGPNAGLAGDSDQRGAEATITSTDANDRSEISAANVTIDGFNFEFGEQAIRSGGGVDSLITNSRFELTADTSNGYAIRAEESSTGIDVTDNLFTGITSNDGTGGDNANGVVVRDPNGTRIAGNNFSSVDTAVNIGSKSNDTKSGTVSVENNEFSGITQFGAVLVNNPDTSLDVDVNNNTIQSSEVGVLTFNADDQATFSIQDNDFENFSNDKEFVDDQAGVLTLDDVLKNQGNTFDPDAVVADGKIVPEVSISNWNDLDDIRGNLDGGYVLVNDLNRSTTGYEDVAGPNVNNGNGFDPIGGSQNPFTGSFDGNGNTISGLVIDRPSQDFVGLFGASTGTITSVTLDQTNTTGGNFVGGLVGANGGGTVSNSSASGVVNGSGNRDVGGLVGQNFGGGTVSNSSASGVVNGSDFFAGGLVGLNLDGTVSNSEASGTVTGDQDVGGLVGDNRGTVSDSSASGDVTGSGTNVGGLVGDNDGGTVTDSSASGDVTGSSDDVGGLVGENTETAIVSNSEASGNVTGSGLSGRSVNVGGLVGDNVGSVDNSSASGAVDGTSRVGGLVGDNEDTGFVDNSSASGDVIGDRSVGALFGENDGTVRNSSGSGNVTQRD